MPLLLGDTVPDFCADSTQGQLDWHKYIDGAWAILFSHPNDFTPVCTTELGEVAKLSQEFQRRGFKLAALSCNTTESHKEWIKDIEAYSHGGCKVEYPIIADSDRSIATANAGVHYCGKSHSSAFLGGLLPLSPVPLHAAPFVLHLRWGMLDPDERDGSGTPMTARAVFVIGPDKRLKLSILYPATTGRNFAEVLRAVDSLQLTAAHSVATPVNWQCGDRCMVVPGLSDEEAAKIVRGGLDNESGSMPQYPHTHPFLLLQFPRGFETAALPSGKNYIRLTPQPNLQ